MIVSQRQRVGAYALCRAQGNVLVCRMSANTASPGVWTLPGGGLVHGEQPADAVLRELLEETGVTGRVLRLLGVHTSVYKRDATSIHGVRLLYEVEALPGALQFEPAGTTDSCAWIDEHALGDFTVVPWVTAALKLSRA